MMNKKLMAAVISASAVLTGCGSDSDDSAPSQTFLEAAVEANPRTEITTANDYCSEFGGTLVNTECSLPSRITATGGEFSAAVTYKLNGLTFLGYGDKELETEADVAYLNNNTVELTIPAGTVIKGQVAKSAFIVTRGAELNAEGTSANPIVFESADSNQTGSGEWGGLVIQGFGISNKCPDTGICNIEAEGGVGNYGGTNNADTSGSFEYVIVTEAGFEVSTDNELNGVGFMAVGSGTTVENLQVNENSDDGVEFWGGAVVVKNLVLTANADDSIDWDNGWVGGIQNALVIQADGAGDHGFETDNDGKSMDSEPRSMPTIANVTLLTGGADTAIKHREGTGALFYNVAVVEQSTSSRCLDIDDAATEALVATGELVYTNVALGCASTSKTGSDCKDGECNGEDTREFAETLLAATQTNSIEAITNGSLVVDGDYVVSGHTAISAAPSIANSAITGNTTMGAVVDTNNKWFAGWTVGEILNPPAL